MFVSDADMAQLRDQLEIDDDCLFARPPARAALCNYFQNRLRRSEGHALGRLTLTACGGGGGRVRTYKVSRDPGFAKKVKDIVGLYLCPPENAIVLSVDEKTSI